MPEGIHDWYKLDSYMLLTILDIIMLSLSIPDYQYIDLGLHQLVL